MGLGLGLGLGSGLGLGLGSGLGLGLGMHLHDGLLPGHGVRECSMVRGSSTCTMACCLDTVSFCSNMWKRLST